MRFDFWEKLVVGLLALALLYSYREDLLFGPIARRVVREQQRKAGHLQSARMRLAAEDAARFVDEHMASLQQSADRYALFKVSLAAVKINGLHCEFGVAGGTTLNHLSAQRPGWTWHGFDSFEGLPEDWRNGFARGTFATDGLPRMNRNVILHKGWFDKTVPEFHAATTEPIAFAHMDADLYSSTKTVLESLADRIVPGTVLQFDEFLGYPGWRNGEYKAFTEFVEAHHMRYRFLGYAIQQVAVVFE